MRGSKRVIIETKLEDMEYQIGVLEEINAYVKPQHQPALLRVIKEKAAEHKALMKIRGGFK